MADTPTDIADVITNGQNVIDSAVDVVTTATHTQAVLTQAANTVNTAVATHNASTEAHEDLRASLIDAGNVLSAPVVLGPSTAEANSLDSWVFTSTSNDANVAFEQLIITLADGTTETVNVESGAISCTWSHTFTGNTGDDVSFTAVAKGGNYYSAPALITLELLKHTAPDVSNAVITLPDTVANGLTYNFNIHGIEDVDDDLTTISLACSNANIEFSRVTNLAQYTTYTCTVPSNVVGPLTFTVTVTATDYRNLTSTFSKTITVTEVPNLSNIVVNNLAPKLVYGKAHTFNITGATDPDGDSSAIYYQVTTNAGTAITVTPSGYVPQGTNVTLAVTNNSALQGTAYEIYVTFKDEDGGTVTHTIASTFDRLPNAAAIYLNSSTNFYAPGETYTVSIAQYGGSTLDEDGDTCTFTLFEYQDNGIVPSKSSVTLGESFTITLDSTLTANRGNTLYLGVTIVDSNGGTTSANLPVVINRVVTSILSNSSGRVVVPGEVFTDYITTDVDQDSNSLSYSIASAYSYANYERYIGGTALSDLTAGASVTPYDAQGALADYTFAIQAPAVSSTMTRGSTFQVAVTISDGIETTTRYLSYKLNQLPSASGVTVNTPEITWGGYENAFSISFSGGSDPDSNDRVVAYRVSSDDTSIVFSTNTVSIGANDTSSATLTIYSTTRYSANTSVALKVWVCDTHGEWSETYATVYITFTPIIITAKPTISYPVTGDVVPHYENWVCRWSDFATTTYSGTTPFDPNS